MNFQHSDKVLELIARLTSFMQKEIYPRERERHDFVTDSAHRWEPWPSIAALKERAREAGLWNLFLPREYGKSSPGLSNLEYAPLAEIIGRVEWAPEIFNCSAPDTGNMEVLAKFGSDAQQEEWLTPLLAGEIRSAYLMTAPRVSSSDATNLDTSIVRDGDGYVINGLNGGLPG